MKVLESNCNSALLANTHFIVSLRAGISNLIIKPNISEAISRQEGKAKLGREIAASGMKVLESNCNSALLANTHFIVSLRAGISRPFVNPDISEAISRRDGIAKLGREIATIKKRPRKDMTLLCLCERVFPIS